MKRFKLIFIVFLVVVICFCDAALINFRPRPGGGRPSEEQSPEQQPNEQGPSQERPNQQEDPSQESNPYQGLENPANEPNLVPAGSPPIGAEAAPQLPNQQNIQQNMGNLEKALEKVEHVVEAVQQLVDIVSAVLDVKDCEPTESAIGAEPTDDECAEPEFTPTTTLPSTSFAACTSFAQVLSACASATSGFYSMNVTAQASCACYTTAATQGVCSGSAEATKTVTPSLADAAFDQKASACRDYFSIQGYRNIADTLGGVQQNQSILGAGFCEKVRYGSTNGSRSVLDGFLSPMQFTDCKGLVSPTSAAASRLGLTTFDVALLSAILVGFMAFPWLMGS